VLLSWLAHPLSRQGAEHHLYCLEDANAEAAERAHSCGIPVHDEMLVRTAELRTACAGADVVLVHWWNHPGLYDVLVNGELPECRMAIWSHVSGYAPPQVFTREIVEYPDRFVLATPYSLDAPVIRAMAPEGRKARVRVVFTCAGTSAGARVQPRQHDGIVVGYVGTVDYCKLHPSFLRMSAAVDIPNVRFVVVGGEQHTLLRSEADAAGVSTRFEFTGRVAEVTPHLATFDIFGYPLRSDHYGTGEQALIEAMAAGLPVVVFDNGCERSLVHDGETGLVVSSESEYSRAIERLCRDAALRRRLGTRAREVALQRFSLDAMVQQWQAVLCEVAALPRTHHRWSGRAPVRGADLFLTSMGGSAPQFAVVEPLDAGQAQAVERDIAASDGAFRASTRGSPFHYRELYPDDPWLNYWCGVLELAMSEPMRAHASLSRAAAGGHARSAVLAQGLAGPALRSPDASFLSAKAQPSCASC
jgi:glycosyltransferase involved in cell wall biosynthesis